MTNEVEGLADILEQVRLLREELCSIRSEMRAERADLKRRVDGNTLTLNLLAGRVYQIDQRIIGLGSS